MARVVVVRNDVPAELRSAIIASDQTHLAGRQFRGAVRSAARLVVRWISRNENADIARIRRTRRTTRDILKSGEVVRAAVVRDDVTHPHSRRDWNAD
jgi:hypothetical protein